MDEWGRVWQDGQYRGGVLDTPADLALLGNADVRLLCQPELAPVRGEVRRCLEQGGQTGYLFASCNSTFPGMDAGAAREFFWYQVEVLA